MKHNFTCTSYKDVWEVCVYSVYLLSRHYVDMMSLVHQEVLIKPVERQTSYLQSSTLPCTSIYRGSALIQQDFFWMTFRHRVYGRSFAHKCLRTQNHLPSMLSVPVCTPGIHNPSDTLDCTS